MAAADTHRSINAVWRIESARLIAGLTRIVRDIGIAEDLAHDALVAALEQWPVSGVPHNPGAWLMTIAKRIARLYEDLAELTPSPIVELNRAVAVAMAFGAQAGLELVDALAAHPSLRGYHLLPSVRGDLLEKVGRFDAARAEFERAVSLTRNERERQLLIGRARASGARASASARAGVTTGDD